MPYALGTCRGCGVSVPGTRCDACKARRREQEATRRAELKAAGNCTVCGAPRAKTKVVGGAHPKRVREEATLCKAHLDYYAARARRAG